MPKIFDLVLCHDLECSKYSQRCTDVWLNVQYSQKARREVNNDR